MPSAPLLSMLLFYIKTLYLSTVFLKEKLTIKIYNIHLLFNLKFRIMILIIIADKMKI